MIICSQFINLIHIIFFLNIGWEDSTVITFLTRLYLIKYLCNRKRNGLSNTTNISADNYNFLLVKFRLLFNIVE